MRNLMEIANAAEVNDYYDLTFVQINELKQMADSGNGGKFDAICAAFKYGYVMGQRAEKAAQRKIGG